MDGSLGGRAGESGERRVKSGGSSGWTERRKSPAMPEDANVRRTLVWISGPAGTLCVPASRQPLTATAQAAGRLAAGVPRLR